MDDIERRLNKQMFCTLSWAYDLKIFQMNKTRLFLPYFVSLYFRAIFLNLGCKHPQGELKSTLGVLEMLYR